MSRPWWLVGVMAACLAPALARAALPDAPRGTGEHTQRCFVAVAVPSARWPALTRVALSLRSAGARVRWVAPETFHVTLRFLGDLAPPRIERLRGLLRAAARGQAPFALEYRGVGTFPDRRHGGPRVLWVGCAGQVDRLRALARAVSACARSAGLEAETLPFNPHVTLGRVTALPPGNTLREKVLRHGETPCGRHEVDAFVLYKSVPRGEGSAYEAIETFSLTRPHGNRDIRGHSGTMKQ